MTRHHNKQKILGWIALGISIAITCLWAFWGIIENFHEGWYFESVWQNLGLMFVQYLSPMFIFQIVTLISLLWPRVGAILHGVNALMAALFFNAFSNAATFFIILPLLGLGVMFWFGRPRPKKLAVSLVIVLPFLTLIIFGTSPAIRVSQRVDDDNLDARLIAGNGVTLTWAPAGPGWPHEGTDWFNAMFACQQLSADGLALSATRLDIWRLPSVDEAVKSMSRHGKNSGGIWNAGSNIATYEIRPDKEPPLWDPHSEIVYWWTSTSIDEEQALIIVYDGKVWPRSKNFSPAYLGFRCVK